MRRFDCRHNRRRARSAVHRHPTGWGGGTRWSDEVAAASARSFARVAVRQALCCRSTSLAVAFLPLHTERPALIRQLSASKCCRSARHQPAPSEYGLHRSNRYVLAGRFRFLGNYKIIWLVCRFVGSRRARVTFFCCPLWEHRNRLVLRLGNRTRGCNSVSEPIGSERSPIFWINRRLFSLV